MGSNDISQPPMKKFCVTPQEAALGSTEITEAVTKYLISSMKPMSEVENEGFVELFARIIPSYQLPCRKTIRKKVSHQCGLLKDRVISELKSAAFCAGQADIWSSRRMHGYFGMSLSYIIDGHLKSRLVACRRFKGSHTGENIAGMFAELSQEFGVTDKLCAMVTDNAANLRKAFNVDPKPVVENVELDSATEADSEAELIRSGVQWSEVQEDVAFRIPPRYSCTAHTLQLVVNDGLKEATDKIKQLVGKTKKLVGSIHMSCRATELLERETGHGIPLANATRWNSTYVMLKALLKASENNGLLLRLAEEIGSDVHFSEKDLLTLKELCNLLEPIASATDRLEVSL